jgi:hypothetical protein
MKNIICLLSFLLLLSSSLFAEEAKKDLAYGVVTKVHGKVIFKDKEVKVGDELEDTGTLITKENSYLQMKIEKWGNFISVSANTTMQFDFSDKARYTLDNGACRWKSFIDSKLKKSIYTKNVAMGIRGTDFLLKANSLLGETEIVMFDGVVHFENMADAKNFYDLKKGQWGGLGGRFGNQINKPLDLSNEILDSMKSSLE